MGVILGQSKNLGQDSASRPADMVYGKKNPNKGIGALEVIRGKYSEAETESDKDLGKSIMPGFRNISLEVDSLLCLFYQLLQMITVCLLIVTAE